MVTSGDFAREAQSNHKSTSWALDKVAYQRGNGLKWESGVPKCNLFVHDMLYDAGLRPPPRTSGGWPITANMWTGNVKDFKMVSSQEEGDIVSDGNHVGIAKDSTYVYSATQHKVTLDSVNSDKPFTCSVTLQRYDP